MHRMGTLELAICSSAAAIQCRASMSRSSTARVNALPHRTATRSAGTPNPLQPSHPTRWRRRRRAALRRLARRSRRGSLARHPARLLNSFLASINSSTSAAAIRLALPIFILGNDLLPITHAPIVETNGAGEPPDRETRGEPHQPPHHRPLPVRQQLPSVAGRCWPKVRPATPGRRWGRSSRSRHTSGRPVQSPILSLRHVIKLCDQHRLPVP